MPPFLPCCPFCFRDRTSSKRRYEACWHMCAGLATVRTRGFVSRWAKGWSRVRLEMRTAQGRTSSRRKKSDSGLVCNMTWMPCRIDPDLGRPLCVSGFSAPTSCESGGRSLLGLPLFMPRVVWRIMLLEVFGCVFLVGRCIGADASFNKFALFFFLFFLLEHFFCYLGVSGVQSVGVF